MSGNIGEADRLELCMLLKDIWLLLARVAKEGSTWERSFAELMRYRVEKVAEKWCKGKRGHE